ncbi:hypothetical protein T05_14851 [Trichinella murrelli]|uniref:Uncharacterized protein n=1 Tax=Trichinella murrelli TaxID=144512 RepID=A0A0V0TJM4_9BILA|nr:hypothetical protein T05_14851 [Trichinella murrelli]
MTLVVSLAGHLKLNSLRGLYSPSICKRKAINDSAQNCQFLSQQPEMQAQFLIKTTRKTNKHK